MPATATCGNCDEAVNEADITCPHCGALLAAYASPSGSVASAVAGETPLPNHRVPTPVDVPVPTPAPVADEESVPVSTAPRPLFDTHVTVESLVEAADGGHAEDLVTIDDPDSVPTAPVVFDVPDYARPPANAELIPELVVPEIGAAPVAELAKAEVTARNNVPVELEPPTDVPMQTQPAPKRKKQQRARDTDGAKRGQKAERSDVPAKQVAEEGQTESYLRDLHKRAGYQADANQLSKQVGDSRPAPSNRGANQKALRSAAKPGKKSPAGIRELTIVMQGVCCFVAVILWAGVVSSVGTGHLSWASLVFAIIFTLLTKYADRVVKMVQKSDR